MMKLSAKWELTSPFTQAKESEITLFNKHVGSQAWWIIFFKAEKIVNPEKFLTKWEMDTKLFKEKVSKYYLVLIFLGNLNYRKKSSCERTRRLIVFKGFFCYILIFHCYCQDRSSIRLVHKRIDIMNIDFSPQKRLGYFLDGIFICNFDCKTFLSVKEID